MARLPAPLVLHHPRVTVEATLQLDESQIAALDALAGYDTDAFLKVFYAQMGKAYLQPHEAGLRSLFESIRESAPGILAQAKRAREALGQEG